MKTQKEIEKDIVDYFQFHKLYGFVLQNNLLLRSQLIHLHL